VRKALVSLGAGPQERLLALAARSFRPYAARHGYDLHLRTSADAGGRPAPWAKIRLLQALQDRYDVLVWLDADLVVVDHARDLAEELVPGRFLHLVEHATAAGRMPNSGVLLLRTGPECTSFLADVWAQEDLTHHRWWENAAICRLLGYGLDPVGPGEPTPLLRDHTAFLDPRWNSIRDAPAPRPRIRHYPGHSLKVRAAFMARDLAVARLRRWR
jgi:hypothetical protein